MKKSWVGKLGLLCLLVGTLSSIQLAADVPHYQGKVILIVDNTVAGNISAKLDRLVVDLVGDGWRVLRHDVDPGPSPYDSGFATVNGPRVREVRALIRADYLAAPTEVKAVFLIGHVPIPYSGTDYGVSGGHYLGAGPSDSFYGDPISPYSVGGWTDTQSAPATPELPQFANAPTDGKFDQNLPPALTKLGVGRVDLYNLPTFGETSSVLISRYFDKDHDFRKGILVLSPPRQALLDAWDSGFLAVDDGLNQTFGVANVQHVQGLQFFPNVQNHDYLVAYGGGNGTRTSAHGVGTTGPGAGMDDGSCCDPVTGYCGCTDSTHNNFVQFNSRAVFVNLYGSFFGSWDQTDVLLRGPIANPYDPANGKLGYGLAVVWGSGFGLDLPTMTKRALGDWLGDALFVNRADYGVSEGLMGDPTLRMHPVAPPSGVTATKQSGNVTITWTASPTAGVSGYNIYRAPTKKGPYVLLNTGGAISGTSYGTSSPLPSDPPDNYYMVRAVKTETIATAQTYVNMSEGAMTSPSGASVPYLAILSAPVNQKAVLHSVDGIANAAALSVDAVGIDAAWNEQLTYQWYKVATPDVALADSSHLSGAQASGLLIRGFQSSDNGTYYVRVVLGAASVTSAGISLTPTDPPHAVADTFSVVHDTTQDLNVLANDTDPDDPNSALTIASVSGLLMHPEGGLPPTITADGRQIHFSALRGCLDGPVTFTYLVTDGVSMDQATVTVNIIPRAVNTAPTLSTIANQQLTEDTSIDVPFTATDDLSPDKMTYVASCSDPNLVPTANLTFTGSGNSRVLHIRGGTHRVGTGTITLQATDEDCASATKVFQVTVNPLNVPTLLGTGFSGNNFQIVVNGPANSTMEVKKSDDLVNWTSMGTVTLNGTASTVTDNNAGNLMHRFYSASNSSGCGVNMVGFIKVVVPPKNACNQNGKALIANQLNNPIDNTISQLLPNMPANTVLWKYDPFVTPPVYRSASSDGNGNWSGSGPSTTLNPGEGGLLENPTTAPLTITFVGDVPQGQQNNSGFPNIAGRFGILSSMIPRSLPLDQLGFPAATGDTVFRFNPATQANETSTFNGNTWSAGVLTPQFGEAFWLQSGVSQSRTWSETLSLCAPSPALANGSFVGNDFRFVITWAGGVQVNVEASSDLVNWTGLGPVNLSGGTYTFVDSGASSAVNRFYRARAGTACSANVYGFMKVTVPGKVNGTGGKALIANQLNNGANTLPVVLANMPNLTRIDKWNTASQSYQISIYTTSTGTWSGSGPTTTLGPGEGAYITNPNTTPLTVTFIGEVPQGQQVNNNFPMTATQWSMVSSIIPRVLPLDQLSFPIANADELYRFNPATQQSELTSYTGGAWTPGVLTLGLGEAVFLKSGVTQTRSWTENLIPCAPPPTLGGGSFVGNDFHFNITGGNGAVVSIAATTDLVSWNDLGTVSLNGGTYAVTDVNAASLGHRYYAVREGNTCPTQVYGFIRVTVPGKVNGTGGQALIANQLNNPGGNTLPVVLANMPNLTKIDKWNTASQSYQSSIYSTSSGTWSASGPTTTLNPGEGAYITNPNTTPLTVTFIGDLQQGQQVNSGLPSGVNQWSILSSIIPRTLPLDQLSFPATNGDTIYHFNPTTQANEASTFNGSTWSPGVLTPGVGEAFWIKSGTNGCRTWTEYISACPPLPALASGNFSGNNFQFTVSGVSGASVNMSASTDLVNWTSLGQVTLSGGSYLFVDSGAGAGMNRFYRAKVGNSSSANTYGFIKVTVPGKVNGTGGKALIANQLNNGANTLPVVLANMPNLTKIEKWNMASQAYQISIYSTSSGTWSASGPTTTLKPGEGAYITNPNTTPLTVTFIGDLPQGQQVNNGFPATATQWSMVSSIIPRALPLDQLGFPIANGDELYRFNPTSQLSELTTYNSGTWTPGVLTLGLGEAVFLKSGVSQSRSWTEFLAPGTP